MRLAVFAVLFAALLVPERAAARSSAATAGGFIVAGPALAGTDVVWADRPTRVTGAVTVRRLDAAGAAQVELVRNDCGTDLDLAASERYVALTGCGSGQIVLAGLDVADPPSIPCSGPMDLVEADLISGGCASSSSTLNVFTLPGGTREGLPIQLATGRTLQQVRMVGQRVATLTTATGTVTPTPTPSATPSPSATATATATATQTPTPTPTIAPGTVPRFVSLYQRTGFSPSFDLSIAGLTGSDQFGAPALRLAIERNDGGTVLVGAGPTTSNPMRFAWASLTSPFLNEVPGDFRRTAGRTTLAGGRFATATLAEGNLDGIPREITVRSLDGKAQARFAASPEYDSVERGVAFDGDRLTWSTAFVLIANAELSDLEPRATKPSVRITSPRGRKRSRKVRFVFGTASDPDGQVAEVRVGIARTSDCRSVTRIGRLGPSRFPGGRCRPKPKYVAQGGQAWTFALKRRLPRGPYVVRALVRDDTGQRAFATRRFRIR